MTSSARAGSPQGPLVSIREATEITGLPRFTIRNFILRRGMDYYQFGGRNGVVRVSRRALEAMTPQGQKKGESASAKVT